MRFAGADTGTTVNGTALVIVEERGGLWGIAFAKEWRGTPGKPIDLRGRRARSTAEQDEGEGQEMAAAVKAHGCDTWALDSYGLWALQLVSGEHGLSWRVQGGELDDVYRHGLYVVHGGRAVFNGPLGPQLAQELQAITEDRRGGKVLPRLASQGRAHSDLASAWLRAMWLAKAADAGAPLHQVGGSPHRYSTLITPLGARLAR